MGILSIFKTLSRAGRAAERVGPAMEGAAKQAAEVVETAAKTEAAAGKAAKKIPPATKRAITDMNEHLSGLTPGRIGKEQLDDRLKALSEAAKQNKLIDASVRTGKDQLSAKAALEKLKNGEKINPKEFSDVQASILKDFEKYEKRTSKSASIGTAGTLNGMSPLAKYGLLGSVAATLATYGFTALTGDDPNDSADNNLTHIQRFMYKWHKSFNGGDQIRLAEEATRKNSERDLQTAEAEKAEKSNERIAKSLELQRTQMFANWGQEGKSNIEREARQMTAQTTPSLDAALETAKPMFKDVIGGNEDKEKTIETAWKNSISENKLDLTKFEQNLEKGGIDKNVIPTIRSYAEASIQ